MKLGKVGLPLPFPCVCTIFVAKVAGEHAFIRSPNPARQNATFYLLTPIPCNFPRSTLPPAALVATYETDTPHRTHRLRAPPLQTAAAGRITDFCYNEARSLPFFFTPRAFRSSWLDAEHTHDRTLGFSRLTGHLAVAPV